MWELPDETLEWSILPAQWPDIMKRQWSVDTPGSTGSSSGPSAKKPRVGDGKAKAKAKPLA